MKIKSWTGNEVEARLFMRVDVKDRFTGKITAIDSEQNECHIEHDGGWNWVSGQFLTMLHCPFQANDIVRSKAGSADFIIVGIQPESKSIKETARVMHMGSVYEWPTDMLIHASPDLRTSPDYTEEKV
jgi:hypothetical protein